MIDKKNQKGAGIPDVLAGVGIPIGLIVAREYLPQLSDFLNKKLSKQKGGKYKKRRKRTRRTKKRKRTRRFRAGTKRRKQRGGYPAHLDFLQDEKFIKKANKIKNKYKKQGYEVGVSSFDTDKTLKKKKRKCELYFPGTKWTKSKTMCRIWRSLNKKNKKGGYTRSRYTKSGYTRSRYTRSGYTRKQRGGFMRGATRNFCTFKK